MGDTTIDYDIDPIIGYRFKRKELLEHTLTTKAYSNEHHGKDQNEFRTIGDAVLKLILTELLMEKGHKIGGTITPKRVKQEKKKGLAKTTRGVRIGPFIKLGMDKKSKSRRQGPCIS